MNLINFLLDCFRRLLFSFSNKVPHVATYTRELPVSLERMYENAIDGEHLPFLHSDSFSELTILESGNWGWRAKANLFPKSLLNHMEIELKLDRDKNRWITRTLSGIGKGTEIWTHAIPIEDHKIKIIVDFYVPKLPSFLKSLYGKQYVETYAKLYDEDLWMMATRQQGLNRVKAAKGGVKSEPLNLGLLTDVETQLPKTFEFNQHPYRLIKLENELIAHSTSCPHMLGPLEETSVENGTVKCPWHGYLFDVKTRKCISGQKCKLAPAPSIRIDSDSKQVIAEQSNT